MVETPREVNLSNPSFVEPPSEKGSSDGKNPVTQEIHQIATSSFSSQLISNDTATLTPRSISSLSSSIDSSTSTTHPFAKAVADVARLRFASQNEVLASKDLSNGQNIVRTRTSSSDWSEAENDTFTVIEKQYQFTQRAITSATVAKFKHFFPQVKAPSVQREENRIITDFQENLLTNEDALEAIKKRENQFEGSEHTVLFNLFFQIWDTHKENLGTNTDGEIYLFDNDLCLTESNQIASCNDELVSPLGHNIFQDLNPTIPDDILEEHLDHLSQAIESETFGHEQNFSQDEANSIQNILIDTFKDDSLLSIHGDGNDLLVHSSLEETKANLIKKIEGPLFFVRKKLNILNEPLKGDSSDFSFDLDKHKDKLLEVLKKFFISDIFNKMDELPDDIQELLATEIRKRVDADENFTSKELILCLKRSTSPFDLDARAAINEVITRNPDRFLDNNILQLFLNVSDRKKEVFQILNEKLDTSSLSEEAKKKAKALFKKTLLLHPKNLSFRQLAKLKERHKHAKAFLSLRKDLSKYKDDLSSSPSLKSIACKSLDITKLDENQIRLLAQNQLLKESWTSFQATAHVENTQSDSKTQTHSNSFAHSSKRREEQAFLQSCTKTLVLLSLNDIKSLFNLDSNMQDIPLETAQNQIKSKTKENISTLKPKFQHILKTKKEVALEIGKKTPEELKNLAEKRIESLGSQNIDSFSLSEFELFRSLQDQMSFNDISQEIDQNILCLPCSTSKKNKILDEKDIRKKIQMTYELVCTPEISWNQIAKSVYPLLSALHEYKNQMKRNTPYRLALGFSGEDKLPYEDTLKNESDYLARLRKRLVE